MVKNQLFASRGSIYCIIEENRKNFIVKYFINLKIFYFMHEYIVIPKYEIMKSANLGSMKGQ
jgi:hypothetical protein